MKVPNRVTLANIGIVLVAGLLFIPFLGQVHLFDWDEINFAESAREMLVTGDYLTVQIDFQPFWEKPPLFIWMQVLSMKLFGINEFAARFPNAICGMATLLVLFDLGRRLKSFKFGIVWTLVYAGSVLPFFYFKSGIIDPWFNLFIFLGIASFAYYFTAATQRKLALACSSAFFIGLAILTKGPVAFLVFLLVFLVYLIIKRFHVNIRLKDVLAYALVIIFTGGFWFILQLFAGNYQTIVDFIVYQAQLFGSEGAGHGGFFGYHFVVLLIGVFPASAFALAGFKKDTKENSEQQNFHLFQNILFWVVLILFSIVKTKIVHYSSLCYFPLTYLAASMIYRFIQQKRKIPKYVNIVLVSVGAILIIVVAVFPILSLFKEQLTNGDFIKDEFTRGNLEAIVHWPVYSYFIGSLLILGFISYFIYLKQKHTQKAFYSLFISSILFISLSVFVLTPRIEAISQRANVEFFQSLQEKDAYFLPLGYKSYAHYFYGKKTPPENNQAYNKNWLLKGPVDKDVYASVKIHKLDRIAEEYPDFELLYKKNGFAFCRRKAVNQN